MKGFLPVLGAGWAMGMLGGSSQRTEEWLWLGVAVAAVMGHIFPVWLGFRGGKGVATGLGVILGVWPHLTIPAAGAAVTWLIFAGTFRYVGLASVVSAVALPGYLAVYTLAQDQPLDRVQPYLWISGAMAMLIVIRHRDNLKRTWLGTESRLGGDKPALVAGGKSQQK